VTAYEARDCSNICIFFRCSPFQVRSYAVSVLEKADDEELLCYLLQLVQALRYERSDHSRLASFLVQRGERAETRAVAASCKHSFLLLVRMIRLLVPSY
jgi:hypothetical protein